jgi:hypothetical protein
MSQKPDKKMFVACVYKFMMIGLLGLVVMLAASCTKTYGVVTDVTPTESGLMITKCDEYVYFNLAYIFIGQGNCRTELQGIYQ